MNKIFKILGKRGRITIPFEIRLALGFAYNDVVSFAIDGENVLVRREKVCDGCKTADVTSNRSITLKEIIEELTPNELWTALTHLNVRWAELHKGGDKNA